MRGGQGEKEKEKAEHTILRNFLVSISSGLDNLLARHFLAGLGQKPGNLSGHRVVVYSSLLSPGELTKNSSSFD